MFCRVKCTVFPRVFQRQYCLGDYWLEAAIPGADIFRLTLFNVRFRG